MSLQRYGLINYGSADAVMAKLVDGGWVDADEAEDRIRELEAERDETIEKWRQALVPAVAEVCLKPSRAELQKQLDAALKRAEAAEKRFPRLADWEKAVADRRETLCALRSSQAACAAMREALHSFPGFGHPSNYVKEQWAKKRNAALSTG